MSDADIQRRADQGEVAGIVGRRGKSPIERPKGFAKEFAWDALRGERVGDVRPFQHVTMMDCSLLASHRDEQNAAWLNSSVEKALLETLVHNNSVTEMLSQLSSLVTRGEISVPAACQRVLCSLKP